MIWLGLQTSNNCAARSRLYGYWEELVERRKLWQAAFATHRLIENSSSLLPALA